MVTEALRARLFQAAAEVRELAYAPYSGMRVGAALLTRKGNIFTGCNVENASYGLTVCAERAAVFAAVAREGPEMKVQALAVVGEPGAPFPPCGACRQVLAEFGLEAVVLFQGEKGPTEARLVDLLPQGFRRPLEEDKQ